MTVEAVTYISDLNVSYPAAGDNFSEGDDHIRNLKTGIKNSFPNVSGAVTPTHTELNYVDGVTSAIQTQLDAKSLVHLVTSTASASAAIDFSSTYITSTYAEYEIHLQNVIPATDANALNLRVSTDGGSTFISAGNPYRASLVYSDGSTVSATGGASGQIQVTSGTGVGNSTAAGGVSGVIRIINPSSTAAHKGFAWHLVSRPAATSIQHATGSAVYEATTAVNGLRLFMSSGNIASGSIKLYGVKAS